MNIGGLYTYPALRYLYKDLNNRYEGHLASIDINEQFVVLEVKRGDLKVLTTQGIVGWISHIDKPHLVEVKEP